LLWEACLLYIVFLTIVVNKRHGSELVLEEASKFL
jgi:hypothetical protein